MKKLFGKFLCLIGRHDWERLPSPEGIMKGFMGPRRCRRCPERFDGFPYPNFPPPPWKQHMGRKEVTVWHRFDEQKKEYAFNHYDEGYNETQTTPISNTPSQQKDWKRAKWRKRFGYLIERKDKEPLLEEEND